MPNARDPWGVMRAVPGVMVDRVNIAGNENGQQATSSSKGQPSAENTWNLDGMVITDMSATGASSTYFDFGAFQEITVTTGGTDLAMATGGAGINITTSRGTNAFHGSARYMVADEGLSFGNIDDQDQSPFTPNSLAMDPRLRNTDGSYRDQGDRIKKITDYGFELGGPIIKDKLWFFGSYGKQDIKLLRLANTPDNTPLPSYNAKLNWQATGSTMVSAFYFLGIKQKFGRSPGSGLGTEEDGFLWNQDNAYTDGGLPGGLWKLQIDHTFSPNLFFSLKGMYYDTGFTLAPRGDLEKAFTLDFVASEALGTYQTYLAVRPQKNLTGDGSYYFQGTGGSHELKFGFSYRDMKTTSATIWSGNQLAGHINSAPDMRRTPRAQRRHQLRRQVLRTSTSATCSRRGASRSTSACASTPRRRPTSRARRSRTQPSRICCRMRSSRAATAASGLEEHFATRGPELRARRVAPDDRAGLLCPLLPTAVVRGRGT